MNAIEYLRQFRIAGFAVFDFSIAFLGMWLISPLLSRLCLKAGFVVPKRNWVILALPISVVFHVIVNNNTPFTKDFFDPHDHYVIKLIVLACCALGVVGVRRVESAGKKKV